ncbi:MAG: sugar phosphate isomerase/epimerase family protein [Ignavibacteria bacterium]|jgi:sugar phosphate isomerase/epimerase
MNKYKFGFNVYNYTPEELLDYSKESNLNHIEINLSKPHSSLDSFDEKRIEELKKKACDGNIEFSFHLPYEINIADNIYYKSRSNIAYISKSIDLAAKLGIKYITSHMGFFFWFPVEKWQRDKSLKRFVQNMPEILQKCNHRNVNIAIENVTPLPHGSEHLLLGDNLNDLYFVFSELESPNLKFCLDTGHANIAEGFEKYLDCFSDKLVSIHYHDNHGNDDSHLPVGKGNIDWSKLGKRLKEINFTGPFVSECRNIKPHEAAEALNKFLL